VSLTCAHGRARAVCPQALALVFTFASGSPGVESLALTLLCIAYLAVHMGVRPMRSPATQTLQTTLLLCLAAVALSGTPFSDALEKGVPSSVAPKATASDTMARRMQTVFGVVGPAVALVWAYLGPQITAVVKVLARRCARRVLAMAT
jgi:hypothetical protein